MGVPVRFTPLCGAGADGAPLAHLLELGPADARLTLLLDAGWCGALGPDALAPLVEAAPRVDAVLLSHPDGRHCGALPILVGRHGLAAPIYGTVPIARMGAMFAYDAYLSARATQEFDAYDLDDADKAFAAVTKLKFTQPATLTGPKADALAAALGAGPGAVCVTPFAGGHMVGGCAWRIEVAGEEVVYAADTNHRRERHLAGCSLEAVATRPALVVTDAACAATQPVERARRDTALVDALMAALRAGGNALLPVDTAGRVLELLLLLDSHWSDNNLRDTYPLVFLSPVGPSTLEFATASLEWMADGLTRGFDMGRGNPFRLRNVHMFGSMAELQASPIWRGARPVAVLASGPDLDPGSLSRQVLLQWARDPRSLLLLTQRPRPGSLGATLAAHAGPAPLQLHGLPVWRRVALEGAELEAWEEARRREREEAEAAAVSEAAAAAAEAAASSGGGQLALRTSSTGLSQLVRGAGGEVVQLLPFAVSAAAAGDKAGAAAGATAAATAETLMEGFEPPAGAVAPMFPDEDEALTATWDVYGETIDADAWRKAASAGAAADEAAEEEEEEGEEEERPTKVVCEPVNLAVAMRHAFVDFEGRSDGRSMRTIVGQLAPRQLVVIGASEAATAELAGGWRADLERFHTRVVAPAAGEEVALALASSFPVALDPRLLAAAHTHQLGPYRVAWLDACVGPPDGPEQPPAADKRDQAGEAGQADEEMADAAGDAHQHNQQQLNGAEQAPLPQSQQQPPAPPAGPLRLLPGGDDDEGGLLGPGAVDPAELEAALATGGPEAAAELLAAAAAARGSGGAQGSDHGGIFIGDVQLSEVKQALAAAGIPSAFRAGKLLCAGAVVVSRAAGSEGEGSLEIEGPLSDDYFRIRDVVYGQYQVC